MGDATAVDGPLAPHLAGFRSWLEGRGYCHNALIRQVSLVSHLSGWLALQGLDKAWLAGGEFSAYFTTRREDRAELFSPQALVPLVDYLHALGELPARVSPSQEGRADERLAGFATYLRSERSLSGFTAGRYGFWAERFLSGRGEGPLAELEAREVHRFLLDAFENLSVPAAKQLVSSLRALLRFLYVSGVVNQDLLGAVPGVRGYSLSSLPRGHTADEVRRLLAAPQRSEPKGLRDYAVLVLLARLGLRAGEVAGLRLDDIDWRRGELSVRGKGRRVERMPLSADVGQAVAAYLRHGRPADPSRALFLTVQAPRRPLDRSGVGSIVVRAGRVAGVDAAAAHRLRHSVATELLAAGAGLTEVGQVLRHASAASTAIYAKVDDNALVELARPWPGRSK